MQLTSEQLEAVRKGASLRLSEGGTDLVVLRADVFERLEGRAGSTPSDDEPWQKWFEKLDTCQSLHDGWNGYTAPAPNDVALANARSFLQVMQQEGIEPTRVAPSAMGGIAITRRVNGRKAFVECYNDGRVYAMLSEKLADMNVLPLAVDSLSFRAFLANVRDYLHVEHAA